MMEKIRFFFKSKFQYANFINNFSMLLYGKFFYFSNLSKIQGILKHHLIFGAEGVGKHLAISHG